MTVYSAPWIKHLVEMSDIEKGFYFEIAESIAHVLPTHLHNQLSQLVEYGPVYDGDVLSKSSRDELLDIGLAVRCCRLGEQGYTAATYLAYSVLKGLHK